jgi:two-component system, NarL family, nitrate/nitrite response regulator NarL
MWTQRSGGGDQMTELRIVLADAQPAFRVGARCALEERGFVVAAEVATAADAVKAVMRERPDICLLDVGLRGSAIGAVREISARAPQTLVAMLAVTMDAAEVLEALRAGAVGYIQKAVDPGGLALMLRALANGEAALLPREWTAELIAAVRSRSDRPRRSPIGCDVELTEREWEVADLLCSDMTTAQIAGRLGVAEVTVRRHISQIRHKLRASDRGAARQLLTNHVQYA